MENRTESKISDETLGQLKKEKHEVKNEMIRALAEGNMASFYRLEKKLARLTKELKHEIIVNQYIQDALQNARYDPYHPSVQKCFTESFMITKEKLKQSNLARANNDDAKEQQLRMLSDKERMERELRLTNSVNTVIQKLNR